MKPKATIISLVGLVVTSVVMAQTNDNPQAESAAVPAQSTSAETSVSSSAASVAGGETNTSATVVEPAKPAEASTTDVSANETTTASSPATAAETSPASAAANSNAQRDPNAVIPLIVMDDVPLTDAIKNLARQAGLNYMLDPKINYGAPGPNGQITPQPAVTLRWENLTADQALHAVLNNYNMTIVDDPKTKIARITIKDPAAPDPLVTKIIQLKYASTTNLVASVQGVLQDKRSRVTADVRTSQLVVVATDKEFQPIDELVAKLDTPTKQVLIEARLVETSRNPRSLKGVDWSGTLESQRVTGGNNLRQLPAQSSVNPVLVENPLPRLLLDTAHGFNPATAFLDADGLSATLSFLNKDTESQVLSTPRAVTLDNEEARLAVTRAQPIFKTTAGTQGSPGGAEVTYTNLGTILKVTPRISANNTISLRVIPEVSSVAGISRKVVADTVNEADIYDIRSIDTQVLIPSGNTLVMGGLVSDDRSKDYVKVPLLGDIPFLGAAFRHQSKTQTKKNLIIFVTPTIIGNEDFQPTQTDFLKNKIPDENQTDFGAWDSGKPQDWSKLMSKDKKTSANDDPAFK